MACTGGSDEEGGTADDTSATESIDPGPAFDGVTGTPGTVTTEWTGFCLATFTEEYVVLDGFGEPDFTVPEGETYLLANYPTPGFFAARALYLTASGIARFDIEADEESGKFPFTSNCSPNPPLHYWAIFVDTPVYADGELQTKLCDLEAGQAVLLDRSIPAGYALHSPGDVTSYEVSLNTLSSLCGDARLGYVPVGPPVRVGEVSHGGPPLEIIDAQN